MAFTTYTLATLRSYVRDLTGVYSTDLIPDSMINAWINEAYSDLGRQQEWSWSSQTVILAALVADGDSPTFPAQYHSLLALRAAAKLLVTQADDTQRAQTYLQEYQAIVDSLVQDDLRITATGAVVNTGDYTDLTLLVKYTRKILNVFDGTVSDALIKVRLLDEYRQICDSQVWTFAYSTNIQPIADYARILAYGAAMSIAIELNKDPNFIASLNNEYTTILNEMKLVLLQSTATGAVVNTLDYTDLTLLVKYTRYLINTYDNSVSNTLIQNKLLDSWRQLCDAYVWGFSYSTSIQPIANYARILAYDVAMRLSIEIGLDPNLTSALKSEYDSILEEMKRVLLYSVTTSPTTLGNIRKYARTLLGNWSADLPDAVLNSWINEAYVVLQGMRDWNWEGLTYTTTLTAGGTTITLPTGASGKILGVFLSRDGNLSIDSISRVPHVLDIVANSSFYKYNVTTAGVITIAPAVTTDTVVSVQYTTDVIQLVNDADTPAFALQFRPLLAYKAAITGSMFNPNASKAITQVYISQAQSLYDAMISYYELDHGNEVFQLNSIALEPVLYTPYFKAP